jgi:hypothetical protein
MLLDFSESCRRCQRAPVSHADTRLIIYSASENSAALMGSRRVRRHPHHRD